MTALRLIAVLGTVLLVSACTPSSTTAQLPQPIDTAATGVAGQRLDAPLPRPHTELVGTDGQPFDLAEATAGRPALVFMGYTSCPDICPVHMAAIARALDETGLRAGRDLDVVFISVDPDRDSPTAIRQFLDAFDRDFLGATGTREQLDALADDLGLPHAVLEGDPAGEDFYTVGHPGQVIAFGPEGPAEFQYPFGMRTSHWISDLPDLVEGTLA